MYFYKSAHTKVSFGFFSNSSESQSSEPAHETTTACTSSVHQGATSCTLTELTENPCEAEVTQFDDLMFGDEDVLGLDVSVDALHRENGANIKYKYKYNNWGEKKHFSKRETK